MRWLVRGKQWTVMTAGFAVLVGAMAWMDLSPRRHRRPILREPAATNDRGVSGPPPLTCAGGADYPVDVALIPDAVVTTGSREAVQYHADINIHGGQAVGLAWQADLLDDRGNIVLSAVTKGNSQGKRA